VRAYTYLRCRGGVVVGAVVLYVRTCTAETDKEKGEEGEGEQEERRRRINTYFIVEGL
jgi:hypothetical protein